MAWVLASLTRLTILIGILVAMIGCQTRAPWPAVEPEAIAAGQELLAVLETGEPERLEHYLATRTDLLGPEWLTESARRFVYDGKSIRQSYPRGRSIMEIIALGDIEIIGPLQPDGSAILEFVPKRYLHEIHETREPAFETSEWMRKFFACWFKKVDGRWQLWMNVCFASTDGPFPLDAG